MEKLRRTLLKSLSLAITWTFIPCIVGGAIGSAMLFGLLAWLGAGTYGVFQLGVWSISTLWLVFATLDGVMARLLNRFRIGLPKREAIIEGWFDTDRKAVEWGPWWIGIKSIENNAYYYNETDRR